MSRNAAVSIATVVGAIVLIVAVALLVVRPWESSTAAPGPSASGASAELVDETTHLLSDAGPDAPVVVEFFDYECPGCGAFHPVVEDLVAEYGEQVTFALRYYPLPSHPNAVPAAVAAEAAAQQGPFLEMHTVLFDRQEQWTGTDAEATFRGYAEELGLDMAAFDAAVADPATLDRVAFDANAGIALGVQSTPTFFVDGEQLELVDYGDVEAAIQAALGE